MRRPLSTTARQASHFGLLAALLAAMATLAVFASSAPAHVVRPVVELGPTTVANGTAVVTGTIGVPNSAASLTINGQPVAIAADGRFAATVNLGGQSHLLIAVRNPVSGETSITSIPLTTNIVGPGGVLGPGVLTALNDAGVTILKPLEGFRIQDGLPLRIEGSVLHKENLASLRVNGVDVLGRIRDGRFTVQIPGTSREVTVTVVDRRDVSQTTTTPVEHATSRSDQTTAPTTPATPAAPAGRRTVDARNAVGVRITRVRYLAKGVARTKRLRVTVTVADRRGARIRGAAVGVRSARARWIARNPRAKRTGRLGQASFVLTVRNRSFGRRLRLIVIAKTPRAKARKASSIRLPRLQRRAAARRR